MRVLKFVLMPCISFACFCNPENPDFSNEDFPSSFLKYRVPISLHVPTPFNGAGWFVRFSLKRTFPMDAEAFAPWNPFNHLGGTAELYLGCGTEDKYGIAPPTETFAKLAKKRERAISLVLGGGNHDSDYWAPEFKRLVPWLRGGSPPGETTALKMQQSVKTL
ncbi:MAG: hypothetical protein IPP78_10270 [Holophagaceae bacterium]|nr:hypothetical protein [Holophagaceae bacterium]